MKEIENTEYMDALSEKIKHGISPEVALQTTENLTGEKISLPTLYLRIDRGLMKCKNIDLRNKLKTALDNNLPVLVSEFGICDASGNGANDFESTTKWLDLLNKYQISFMCWNLANKDESSSVFRANITKVSDWTEEDLSEAGQWIKAYFKNRSYQ